MMFRTLSVLAVTLVAGGCSWPPSLAAPPVAPNAAGPVQEQAEVLPGTSVPERPVAPRLSPPSIPRIGGSRGGLL